MSTGDPSCFPEPRWQSAQRTLHGGAPAPSRVDEMQRGAQIPEFDLLDRRSLSEVERDRRLFNSAIPLVPDKRDSASWARLRELEEEVEVLTGKIAILERDNADLQEAVARMLRAIPVDPVHDTKEELR